MRKKKAKAARRSGATAFAREIAPYTQRVHMTPGMSVALVHGMFDGPQLRELARKLTANKRKKPRPLKGDAGKAWSAYARGGARGAPGGNGTPTRRRDPGRRAQR